MEDYAIDIIIGKGPSADVHSSGSAEVYTDRRDHPGGTAFIPIAGPVRRELAAGTVPAQGTPEDCAPQCGASGHPRSTRRAPWRSHPAVAGTPRLANRMLRAGKGFCAGVRTMASSTGRSANDALNRLEVDHLGLDETDRRMLRSIIVNYGGGPVGLETLAATHRRGSGDAGGCV